MWHLLWLAFLDLSLVCSRPALRRDMDQWRMEGSFARVRTFLQWPQSTGKSQKFHRKNTPHQISCSEILDSEPEKRQFNTPSHSISPLDSLLHTQQHVVKPNPKRIFLQSQTFKSKLHFSTFGPQDQNQHVGPRTAYDIPAQLVPAIRATKPSKLGRRSPPPKKETRMQEKNSQRLSSPKDCFEQFKHKNVLRANMDHDFVNRGFSTMVGGSPANQRGTNKKKRERERADSTPTVAFPQRALSRGSRRVVLHIMLSYKGVLHLKTRV